MASSGKAWQGTQGRRGEVGQTVAGPMSLVGYSFLLGVGVWGLVMWAGDGTGMGTRMGLVMEIGYGTGMSTGWRPDGYGIG